jgi:hypothetical protein
MSGRQYSPSSTMTHLPSGASPAPTAAEAGACLPIPARWRLLHLLAISAKEASAPPHAAAEEPREAARPPWWRGRRNRAVLWHHGLGGVDTATRGGDTGGREWAQ